MIQAHNCFPEDWIGKSLKRVNDMTYFVGGDSTRQVSMPSGYGKPISAQWLPNGVLRMDSDTNNTKVFFVGFQRMFFVYNNQNEPDDPKYKQAVKECQRLRAEEAERKNPKPKVKSEKTKKPDKTSKSESKSFWGKKSRDSENEEPLANQAPTISYTPYDGEDTSIDESLLGDDYDKKEPIDQLTHLLSLYKNGQATGEQVWHEIDDVVDATFWYDVEEYFEEFENKVKDDLPTINPKEWALKFLERFPIIYRNKYLDLKEHKELPSDDELGESSPSGLFDLATRMRNSSLRKLKESRHDNLSMMSMKQRGLLSDLIRIEKTVRRYIRYIDDTEKLKKELETKKKGILDSLFNSEVKDIKRHISDNQEMIKEYKDDIRSLNKELLDDYKEFKDYEEKAIAFSKKLYKQTKADLYLADLSISGESIRLIQQIMKKPRETDYDYLKKIFGIS